MDSKGIAKADNVDAMKEIKNLKERVGQLEQQLTQGAQHHAIAPEKAKENNTRTWFGRNPAVEIYTPYKPKREFPRSSSRGAWGD